LLSTTLDLLALARWKGSDDNLSLLVTFMFGFGSSDHSYWKKMLAVSDKSFLRLTGLFLTLVF